ncbi:MAG TPA: hypothetical protein VGM88_21485 [Kofleriaceae bacterium]|jgi:hypothetical protein
MGLAERRAAKDFQDKQFVELKKEIEKAAGFAVPLDISWDQLAKEGSSHLYAESWPELYFKPLVAAFRQIARDDMGKEALAAGLKKIEIRNAKGAYSPHSAISFDNGTLVIDHDLSNVGDTDERTKYIIEIVEQKL